MIIPASGVRGMGMRRGEDKSKVAAILKTMPAIDVAASLAFFEEYGDFCDCEIVFNVGSNHRTRRERGNGLGPDG